MITVGEGLYLASTASPSFPDPSSPTKPGYVSVLFLFFFQVIFLKHKLDLSTHCTKQLITFFLLFPGEWYPTSLNGGKAASSSPSSFSVHQFLPAVWPLHPRCSSCTKSPTVLEYFMFSLMSFDLCMVRFFTFLKPCQLLLFFQYSFHGCFLCEAPTNFHRER